MQKREKTSKNRFFPYFHAIYHNFSKIQLFMQISAIVYYALAIFIKHT